VTVTPRSLHFGKLIAGQRGTMAFQVSAPNGTPVRGQISALVPWLVLDTTQLRGANTLVQAAAETSRLPGPGVHQTNVQIVSGGQRIYVPVTVEVVAARGGAAKPNPGTSPSASQGAQASAATVGSARSAASAQAGTHHVPAKYLLSRPKSPRLARLATSLVMAFGLAVAGLLYVPQVLVRYHIGVAGSPPAVLLALLAATALAIPGAWAGSAPWMTPGRLRAVAIGAACGLVAALMCTGPLAFTQQGQLLVAGLAAVGAAFGADSLLGRALLATAAFVTRRLRIFVPLATMIAGAWAGVLLAAHAGMGWLIPLALISGAILGWALGSNLARLLERMTRVARSYP
jgi:hypothetical protein